MNLKNYKGITLIALVITIIVLLILAGVSISAITGENGIVEKARDAAEKTEEAEKEEQDTLKGYEDWINDVSSDLEPSEPDPTFPYGTYYAMQVAEEYLEGAVIYENGVLEIIGIEGELTASLEISGTGQVVIEGNTIKVSGSNWATIPDDYSIITIGSIVLNKTTTEFDYCVHEWTTSDDTDINTELHECTKCDMYGIHDLRSAETTHDCDLCGLSENHIYDLASCTVCGYGCTHSNVTTSSIDNADGTHTVTAKCVDCNTTTSEETVSHTDTDSNGTCDGCTATITSTTNIITFTIEGVEYQAENGMTWNEWIDSSYNTDGFIRDTHSLSSIATPSEQNWITYDEPGFNYTKRSEMINANYNYYLNPLGGLGWA